jgi:hypothetical protein
MDGTAVLYQNVFKRTGWVEKCGLASSDSLQGQVMGFFQYSNEPLGFIT